MSFTLHSQGTASSGFVESHKAALPLGSVSIVATGAGSFIAHGKVVGPGGEGTCGVPYLVKERPPTCVLTANPSSPVFVGQPISFTITAQGKVTASAIDGNPTTSRRGLIPCSRPTRARPRRMGGSKARAGAVPAKWRIRSRTFLHLHALGRHE